jgi:hypothetical protein
VVVDSRQENLTGRFGNYSGYILIEKRRWSVEDRVELRGDQPLSTAEGRQVRPNTAQVNEAVDRPQQGLGHMAFERKLVNRVMS